MPRSAGPHRLRISGGDFQQKHSQNVVIGGSSEPLASCAPPYVSRLVKKAGQSVPLSSSSPSASRSMTVEAFCCGALVSAASVALHQPVSAGIGHRHPDNRYCACRFLRGSRRRSSVRNDDGDTGRDKFGRKSRQTLGISARGAIFEPNVLPFDVTEIT